MNAADLNTLPIGAVILSASGVAYQRLTNGRWLGIGHATSWPGSMLARAEPFTLIHPLDTERTEP